MVDKFADGVGVAQLRMCHAGSHVDQSAGSGEVGRRLISARFLADLGDEQSSQQRFRPAAARHVIGRSWSASHAVRSVRTIASTWLRMGVTAFAVGLLPGAANANGEVSYHHLEAIPGALQPCRPGMLLTLPPRWEAGDGAVVLISTVELPSVSQDEVRSTLLADRAAVLEPVLLRCEHAPKANNSLIAGAVDALEALTLTMGAGMTVAIADGPGASAILDVLRAPHAEPLQNVGRSHFAAAMALGDGTPAFARGGPLHRPGEAQMRLKILCEALRTFTDDTGAPDDLPGARPTPEACMDAMASTDAGSPRQASWPTREETAISPSAARTAFQVDGAAGMLEVPARAASGRVPVVLVLHDSLGLDGRSDAYAAQILGAGIAVLDLAAADAGGIAAALHMLAREPRLDVSRLGVLGFGAGARLAAELPFPFAAHALLYPGCADLGGPPGRGAEVVLMHGAADPTNTREACAQAAQRYEAAGVRVHQQTFAGATYAWDYPSHGVESPILFPAPGVETRVRVRPWPALVALSATELAGFFARALSADAQ